MEKSANYWKERVKSLENAQYAKTTEYYNDLQKQFRMAQNSLQMDIHHWYQRLASNNDISLAEAKKLLDKDELEEFHWTVEEYIKRGEESSLNERWMKQLENASARVHINRLEAMKLQIQQHSEMLYQNYERGTSEFLSKIYEDGYYHTAYEIVKGTGIGSSFSRVDTNRIDKVINTPWGQDGKVFSDRIWQDKDKLVRELHTELTQSIIRGENPDMAAKRLAKRMGSKLSSARTLVYTESAAISSVAQNNSLQELGVEEFEVVETLDSHTCRTCGDMDGRHFKIKYFEIGVTAPPFHPRCRGCTCPYFDDEFTTGERVARGADGKKYYVPENTTYEEWKKSFVDGDKPDLKPVKKDDTVELKSKIADTDVQISDLKKQFSDTTDGYSYDEWFKDFKSIEEGYGETPNGDETYDKLKDLEQKVRNVSTKRSKLLKQKERRGQLDTGYKGKIPDDELDAFNKRALEQIKLDTGYSDEKAKEFQDALKEYFGGDYGAILSGETQTAKIIRDGLDLMPVYDGGISRGMPLNNSDVTMFSNLKIGDELPQRGIIESWTSEKGTAIGYSGISDYERSSVILECENNETAVGVQHLSLFGTDESEVLSSSKYEVVEMITENKYDYLSKHKEYLYFPEDLEDEKAVLKENVVCIIKVKEKS